MTKRIHTVQILYRVHTHKCQHLHCIKCERKQTYTSVTITNSVERHPVCSGWETLPAASINSWDVTVITATAVQNTHTHAPTQLQTHTLTVNGKLIAVYSQVLLNSVLGSVEKADILVSHLSRDLFHTCPPPCSACLSVFRRQTEKREWLKTERERDLQCWNSVSMLMPGSALPPSLPHSFLQGQWVELPIWLLP